MVDDDLKVILYVDDDPDIQAVAQIALESIGGYVVQLCGSGNDAVRLASQIRPDLILLDVVMPEPDGPATLAKLKADVSVSQIPVIFMTGRAQTKDRGELEALNVIGILGKPFDPMTLAAQVAEIWRRDRSQHG